MKNEIENKYPEFFENCFDFSIGKGWYPLVESFCAYLKKDIQSIKEQYNRANENVSKGKNLDIWQPRIKELEEKYKQITENPPFIVQVKEKFSLLNVYCYNLTDEQNAVNMYLYEASDKICEDCGCPATVKTKGWIRTLCDRCAKIYQDK